VAVTIRCRRRGLCRASAAARVFAEFVAEAVERMIVRAEIHIPHALLAIEARIAGLGSLGLGALDAVYEVAGDRFFRENLEIPVDRHPEVGEHLVEAKLFGLCLQHRTLVRMSRPAGEEHDQHGDSECGEE